MNNVRLLVVVAFLLLISGVIFVSVTTVRDPGTSSISGAVVYNVRMNQMFAHTTLGLKERMSWSKIQT